MPSAGKRKSLRSVFLPLPSTTAEFTPKSLRNDLREHALVQGTKRARPSLLSCERESMNISGPSLATSASHLLCPHPDLHLHLRYCPWLKDVQNHEYL